MGAWGSRIFDDDEACDVRDYYRELIEDGVEDGEASRLTLEKFDSMFNSPEINSAGMVAFAVTQSKIGRLDPVIRDRALAWIDNGGDLEWWAEDNP